jgi:hypothetical protein
MRLANAPIAPERILGPVASAGKVFCLFRAAATRSNTAIADYLSAAE